jgi:hypothetical protein
MFARRDRMKEQTRRDEEWRVLVRSITDPEGAPSDDVEARFRAYLDELAAGPRRRLPRWMARAARTDAERVLVERDRR